MLPNLKTSQRRQRKWLATFKALFPSWLAFKWRPDQSSKFYATLIYMYILLFPILVISSLNKEFWFIFRNIVLWRFLRFLSFFFTIKFSFNPIILAMPKKHSQPNKVRKRKHKDLDQIDEDLKPEKAIKLSNQPVDYDLPGDAQFYCIECARYFIDGEALSKHRNTKGIFLIRKKVYD